MLNDVVGYGSQGFSYTENYKESIYYLVKCIELINESELYDLLCAIIIDIDESEE